MIPPISPQDHFSDRCSSLGVHRTLLDPPKWTTPAPKRAPKQPKRVPKHPKRALKRPRRAPKHIKGLPRSPKDSPRSPQKPPQEPQGAPEEPQRRHLIHSGHYLLYFCNIQKCHSRLRKTSLFQYCGVQGNPPDPQVDSKKGPMSPKGPPEEP